MRCVDVSGLCKRFGGLAALTDVSFQVEHGEVLSLIGPNGAGKTTLFNVMTGFLRPNRGTVTLVDKDITGRRPHQIASVGMVRTFQLNKLFMGESALENVLLGLHLSTKAPYLSLRSQNGHSGTSEDLERAQELLEFLGLGVVCHSRASALPHGQQRMLGIAVALAAAPKVLLLDEPATGLSEKERTFLMGKIRELRDRGTSVVLVEHNMRLVMDISDRIVVLDFGKKIAEGAPSAIARNPEVIKAYLGDRYGDP